MTVICHQTTLPVVERDSLGFVVIGRNEEARLPACLQSVAPFRAPMVYVDSRSTDCSAAIAQTFGAEVVILDDRTPLNASRARREGLDRLLALHPRTRYVQFIDGDCKLAPAWPGKALEFLDANPSAAVVCGRRREERPGASFYNRLCDDEWDAPVGRVESCGGDALMRTEAVALVGSFNPTLMASEEPELCARLRAAGWEIYRLDEAMTTHDAAMFRYSQWWRRAMRAGFGNMQAALATRHLRTKINRRVMLSALLWVVALPAAFLLAAVLWNPVALAGLPLLYALQLLRMVRGYGSDWRYGARKAAVQLLSKVPELIGAICAVLGQRSHAIEYKRLVS